MHRFTTGDYLLQTTKDRILLITSKSRMLQIKGESGWTGHAPYLGGLAQTLGSQRYSVNICCLNSEWGSFSKSKSHSSQGTMQAWFLTGEPVHGRGSCPPNLAPHWLVQVGAGPPFPRLEWFPILINPLHFPFRFLSYIFLNLLWLKFQDGKSQHTGPLIAGGRPAASQTVWGYLL